MFRKILITAAVVAAATLTAGGTAQAAAPAGRTGDTAASRLVAGMLRYNPGSKQVGPASVEVGPGVVMTYRPHADTVSRQASPAVSISFCSAGHGDPVGWLCLYQDKNWGGYEIDFYNCGNVNLGDYYMGDGKQWNDQISSIDNDQTSGVVSVFYNYTGSGDPNSSANWRRVISLSAGNYLRNLADNSSADGGNANDKIDIVHVC